MNGANPTTTDLMTDHAVKLESKWKKRLDTDQKRYTNDQR